MRKGTYKYKIWLIRRNEKNLRTRNRLKKHSRQWVRDNHNRKLKETNTYNEVERRFEFKAPNVFSIIENPEETINYFNRILKFVSENKNRKRHIHIDIAHVTKLTSDALMYLIAIVNDIKPEYHDRNFFEGNEPLDPRIRKKFIESGFYDFVDYRGSSPITRNKDNIQIVSGEKCDTSLAKKVSDFVCEKSGLDKVKCKFLYNIMIELMSNTHKHAYEGDDYLLLPRWYCYAKYSTDKESITFTFMDTGSGIPATVAKKFGESFLKNQEENEFVISALRGEARTSTKLPYRGKGLPTIREFCVSGKIKGLHIMANKASVVVDRDIINGTDLTGAIKGTLFMWNLDVNELKGV